MKFLLTAIWLLALSGAYTLGASGAGGKAGVDAAPALAASLSERNPLRRSFGTSRALRALDADSVIDVLQVVEDAGLWFDSQEYQLLMAAWIPIDPVSPVGWAGSRPGLLARRARIALADGLGFFDAPRAREMISSLGLSDQAEVLHLHMVQGWARSEHRDQLTPYLEKLPQGLPRQRAARALISELLKDGPDATIEWADEIPADSERQFKQMTFKKAANAIAGIAPARAAKWVGGQLEQGYAVGAPKVVGLRWVQQDPTAAMDWLVALPKRSGGAEPVTATFQSWVERDVRAAEKWALRAAPATGVDPAIRVLVRRHFDRQPAKAMMWANRIDARQVRLRVQASAGRAWLRSDRDAFMAWLPESGLDDQVRDLILNTARKRPAGAPEDSNEPATPSASLRDPGAAVRRAVVRRQLA